MTLGNARSPLALDRKSSGSVPLTTISRDSINGGERAVSLTLADWAKRCDPDPPCKAPAEPGPLAQRAARMAQL